MQNSSSPDARHLQQSFFAVLYKIREGTFFIGGGGGGGPGLRRGGPLVIFLQIGEGQTCFVHPQGRVTLFSARKKLHHVASIKVDCFICYQHAKITSHVNPNYLQVSKNMYVQVRFGTTEIKAPTVPYKISCVWTLAPA